MKFRGTRVGSEFFFRPPVTRHSVIQLIRRLFIKKKDQSHVARTCVYILIDEIIRPHAKIG